MTAATLATPLLLSNDLLTGSEWNPLQSRELLQGLIYANDLFLSSRRRIRNIGSHRNMRGIGATTLREPLARKIHHDRTHHATRIAEKMRSVVDVEVAHLHEPQITLVHEYPGIEQGDLGGPP